MNPSALIMLLTSYIVVTAFSVYFFYKVLTTPSKDADDFPPGA